jgi:DNA mismatch endonuclease, patch repair protein
MDILTPEERSNRMRLIRSKNTAVEVQVRRMIHSMGYRYRLHSRNLPGKPDLVFSSKKSVIFIHGCFWHSHDGCKLARRPKSNQQYWDSKLESNKLRDFEALQSLDRIGWKSLVIWECELSNPDSIRTKVKKFLK